jgi:hypothetical protein
MPKQSLASMSVDALLKLKDDVLDALGRKADDLKHQLSRLGGGERKAPARRKYRLRDTLRGEHRPRGAAEPRDAGAKNCLA